MNISAFDFLIHIKSAAAPLFAQCCEVDAPPTFLLTAGDLNPEFTLILTPAKSRSGCNTLIQNGTAKMALNGVDIIEHMRWNIANPKVVQPKLFYNLSQEEEFIYNLIRKSEQISIDEIHAKGGGYTPSQIASFLLQLEFQGLIECRPGKIYRCVRR